MEYNTDIVFLDNSIFCNEKFNIFSNKKFTVLKEATEKNIVRLVSTRICKGEFISSYILGIKEELNNLKKCIILKNNFNLDVDIISISDLKNKAEEFWTIFVDEFNIEMIDTDVSQDEVFSLYFDEQPPFDGKNKKNEFPDAFNMKTIEAYAYNKALIASQDPDYERFFKNTENVHLFKNLRDLIIEIERRLEEQRTKEEKDLIFLTTTSIMKSKNLIFKHLQSEYQDYVYNSHTDSIHSEMDFNSIQEFKILSNLVLEVDLDDGTVDYEVISEVVLNLDIVSTVHQRVEREDIVIGYNRNSLSLKTKAITHIKADSLSNIEIFSTEIEAPTVKIDPNWEDGLE